MMDDPTVEAIISACELALLHGSEEVQAAARMLLLGLGRQLVDQRERALGELLIPPLDDRKH